MSLGSQVSNRQKAHNLSRRQSKKKFEFYSVFLWPECSSKSVRYRAIQIVFICISPAIVAVVPSPICR